MLVVLSRAARRTPFVRALATHTSPHGTIAPPNQSFTEYVAAKVQQHDPSKPMLVDALSGQTLTFGQFAPRVARAAERLKTAVAPSGNHMRSNYDSKTQRDKKSSTEVVQLIVTRRTSSSQSR